jgi:hypothetical protein
MDAILSKRHDVNPMFTPGSDLKLTATASSKNVQDSTNSHTNASPSDNEMSSECCREIRKRRLSASACRQREKRKLEKSKSSSKLTAKDRKRGKREKKEMKELKRK